MFQFFLTETNEIGPFFCSAYPDLSKYCEFQNAFYSVSDHQYIEKVMAVANSQLLVEYINEESWLSESASENRQIG